MLRGAGLVLVGVVVALGAGELVARWAFDPPTVLIEPDPILGWRYVPSLTGSWAASAWKFDRAPRIPVRVNSQGLLDREYPFEKPPGVVRVLVLADSVGGDPGVPLDALFPKVAERRAGADRRWSPTEVINAGVTGFGTAQELAMFEAVGWRYEPDVVVLTFSMSDVGDSTDLSEPRPRAVFQDGLLALEPPRVPSPVAEPPSRARLLGAHSRLYALAREKLVRIPATRRVLARLHLLGPRVLQADAGFRDGLRVFLADDDAHAARGWGLTAALLRRLRDRVQARGARFVVIIAPIEGQVYPERFPALWNQHFSARRYDLDKPNRVLREFLATERIPALDLLPAFRARSRAGDADLYRRGDGHWTVQGH